MKAEPTKFPNQLDLTRHVSNFGNFRPLGRKTRSISSSLLTTWSDQNTLYVVEE